MGKSTKNIQFQIGTHKRKNTAGSPLYMDSLYSLYAVCHTGLSLFIQKMQWDIRITNVSDDIVLRMLERFSNDAQVVAVKEGGDFDTGTEPHVHIYCVTKSSESWIRKQIQNMDIRRKGNALYSLKKAHENSPNYALKHVYETIVDEDRVLLDGYQWEQIRNNSRILFLQNVTNDDLSKWFTQWKIYIDNLVAERSRSRSVRKKSAQNFSFLIIEEATLKFQEVRGRPQVHNVVSQVIQLFQDKGHKMPTRSQMEVIVLSILSKLGDNEYLQTYYMKNFSCY